MENNKSMLLCREIEITPQIQIKIPTIGEILENETLYYTLAQSITASPYSCMVQLDDVGIDFTAVTDFDLFLMNYKSLFYSDISLLFGDTFKALNQFLTSEDIEDSQKERALFICTRKDNGETVLYDAIDDIIIDRYIYGQIADIIRKINLMEKETRKPGNDAARKYLISKERKRQRRIKEKEQTPYLENLVIALVNKQEFKYDFDSVRDLTIYQFNQSLKQISHTVQFDKTMIGVYAGTVDTTKMTDKSVLSFIQSN